MQDHITHLHNLIKHYFGLIGLTAGINTVSRFWNNRYEIYLISSTFNKNGSSALT